MRRWFSRRRLAWSVVVLVLGVGLFAEFLAWDRPLYLDLEGRRYVLPNVIDYQALDGLSGERLRQRMGPDDLAIWPPLDQHPNAVRHEGRISALEGPSRDHVLGTDDRGRDVLARLVHGARTSMLFAVGAAGLALFIGLGLALLAVWAGRSQDSWRARGQDLGGLVDGGIVALCDTGAAVPTLVFAVAVQGLMGHGGALATIVLIALPRAADTARIARSALIAALATPYVEAARALGASSWRILVHHALRAAWPQLRVAAAITAATAVLAEAALGFLGFGASPPDASWGELLRQAHENDLPWHLVVPAGLAVSTVALALGALAQPGEAEKN